MAMSLPPAAEVRWKRGSTEPVRRGVLVSLGLFQRATARELWHLVLPRQRNDKATRDALVDLEVAGRVREELRLLDNRKLWTLTAAGRREAVGLLPAGAKLAALRPERDGQGTAFSEHTLDVVATAGRPQKPPGRLHTTRPPPFPPTQRAQAGRNGLERFAAGTGPARGPAPVEPKCSKCSELVGRAAPH
ncbi:hypothetical protein [Kitasatospora sp. NPDC058190]|uniref:hypothetical protein n=1 Tax=Kitasatospora sp. NPDC058190 TaxID=3346371 RepID=UPI0036DD1BD1